MSDDVKKKTKKAFDAPRREYFNVDPAQLVIIGLDTGDGPEHPFYDERVDERRRTALPLNQDMVDTVIELGVMNPVRVFRDKGGRDLVEAGRQRVRWAREANSRRNLKPDDPGYITVPVIKVNGAGTDLDKSVRGVVENEHRVPDPPYIKARKAKRLLDQGMHPKQVAKYFGCSVMTVTQWLELLDLPDPVQKELADGRMTAYEAKDIKDAPEAVQKEYAAASKAGDKEAKAKAKRKALDATGREDEPVKKKGRPKKDDPANGNGKKSRAEKMYEKPVSSDHERAYGRALALSHSMDDSKDAREYSERDMRYVMLWIHGAVSSQELATSGLHDKLARHLTMVDLSSPWGKSEEQESKE